MLQPGIIPVCSCCPSWRKAGLRTCMATSAQPLRKSQPNGAASVPALLSLAWFAICSFSIPLRSWYRSSQPSQQGLQGAWPKEHGQSRSPAGHPALCRAQPAPNLHPTSSLFIPIQLPCLLGGSHDKRQCHKLRAPLYGEHFAVAGREVAVLACLPRLLQEQDRDPRWCRASRTGNATQSTWPQTAPQRRLLSVTTKPFKRPHLFSPDTCCFF